MTNLPRVTSTVAALLLLWVAAASANSVTHWSAIAQNAVTLSPAAGGAGKAPASSTVYMSMVHIAIYESVNAIVPSGYRGFTEVRPTPRPGASLDAAVAAASHGVLVGMFPAQQAALDAHLAAALAAIPDGDAKADGVTLGAEVAAAVLLWRINDGRDASYLYTQPAAPGVWQRTPPAFAAPVGIELPHVTPFALTSPSQFRPNGPPALRSPRYAADWQEVKDIGNQVSAQRSGYQSETARFLTEHTQQQLNRAFIALALERGLDVPDTARLFAMIHAATADSAIACYEAKYHYNFWRPIQAIPRADEDGNGRTDPDISWLPLVNTPAHPEYPSSHNCHTSAAMLALRRFFGSDRIDFTVTSTVTGTTHRFDRFSAFTDEVVDGRIWGGLHFRFSTEEGKKLGEKTARWMFCTRFTRADEPVEQCQ